MRRNTIVSLLLLLLSLLGCQQQKFKGSANRDEDRWHFEIEYPDKIRFIYAMKDIEIQIGKKDSFKYANVFYELPDDKEVKISSAMIDRDTIIGYIVDSEMEKIMKLSDYNLERMDFFEQAYYRVRIKSMNSYADYLYSMSYLSFYVDKIN